MGHVFQSFWAGELSPYHKLSLRSFADHGHTFHLYTFDKTTLDVPAGIEVRDAAEILGPDEFFVYGHGHGAGSPAAFANLFRYRLLAEKGGWWVDTDVLCLTPEIPAFETFFAAEDERLFNIALLYFEPGHPLMVRCFEEGRHMGRDVRWGETGPYLFTRLVRELRYQDRAAPMDLCYALHHSRMTDILRPSQSERIGKQTKSSLFVHLYCASLDIRGVEKTRLPPPGSALAHWISGHPVDGWHGEYDEDTVERTLVPDYAR